jgi:hypothetical protein
MSASIVVREFNSQNYFTSQTDSFAQVATTITSTWGPAVTQLTLDTEDSASWTLITAGEGAVENFRLTYGDPDTSVPGLEKSYSVALALLAAGYDVLVCRTAVGLREQYIQYTDGSPVATPASKAIAKYVGSFGSRISYEIAKIGSGLEAYFRLRIYVDKIQVESWDLQPSDLPQISSRPNLTATDIGKISKYLSQIAPMSITEFGAATTLTFNPVGMGSDTGDVLSNVFPVGWVPLADPINPTAFNPTTQVITYEAVMDAGEYDQTLVRKAKTKESGVALTLLAESKALVLARQGNVDTGMAADYTAESTALTDASRTMHNIQSTFTLLTGVETSITKLMNGSGIPGVFAMLSDYFRYSPRYIISPVATDMLFTSTAVMHSLHFNMWYGAAFGRGARAIVDYPLIMDPKDGSVFSEQCNAVITALKLGQDDSKPNQAFIDGYPSSFGSTIGPEIVRVLPEYSAFPTSFPASMGWLLGRIKNKDNYFSSMAYYPQGASSQIDAEGTVYDIGKGLYQRWQKNTGVSSNPVRHIPLIGYCCFGDNTWMTRSSDGYNPVESAQLRDVLNWVRDWVFQIGINLCLRLNNAEADQIFIGMLQPKLVELKKAGVIKNYKIVLSPSVKTNTIKRRTKVGSVRLEMYDIIENVDVGLYMYPIDGLV